MDDILTPEFRAFSARLGQDPMRVQGAGGNTSIKDRGVMWVKASGTELANAEREMIFVAVDRDAARAEAAGAGDGTCKSTVLDPEDALRPSIETTFHAALNWPVVAHTHSIATLVHAISPEGRKAAATKLEGLDAILVPYAKPGLALTREILSRIQPETRVILLENHGLICCGQTVEDTEALMEQVERRLAMPVVATPASAQGPDLPGFNRHASSWMAFDERVARLALQGSYYPDHVVFLGPALPQSDTSGTRPAILVPGEGVYLRKEAKPAQEAMLTCLADCLARLPSDWSVCAIGPEAEAALLDWDAEKYRQALAARS